MATIWKPLNRNIAAMGWPIAGKFGMMATLAQCTFLCHQYTTLTILHNKTKKKQNRFQFIFVVKAAASKQQISKFYTHMLLFKRLRTCLAEPLSMMCSSFFSINQVPRVWYKAIVTPVFKSGSSCDFANYRPIWLTCVASKLMERVTTTRVLDYLRMHKLISKHQHGFLSRCSTVTNLLDFGTE